jgi:alanine racemase
MDVCMIDVTDIPDAQEGDQVILFGNELSPSILADIVGTIPYEILTSVSSRVKRVYYHE